MRFFIGSFSVKISIFCHAQKSYSEAVFSFLGKGRQHAALIYTEWFRKGVCDGNDPAFNNAQNLLAQIKAMTNFSCPLEKVDCIEENSTKKYILKTDDGLSVESVFIDMRGGGTICVSSQVGCRRGCAFCQTGKMGLIRNLTVEEIVAQVFYLKVYEGLHIRNIVFMGMGEPFDNYDNVMKAITILNDDGGMGFGPSRITVSTSGNVDGIYRLLERDALPVNLAVSVNASHDQQRDKLMPINRRYNLASLGEAMRRYCQYTGKKIFVEYVLLKGVNDSLDDAKRLAEYLDGVSVTVNVIPYNSGTKSFFVSPSSDIIDSFVGCLRDYGLWTSIRNSKGSPIMAACGQLGSIK